MSGNERRESDETESSSEESESEDWREAWLAAAGVDAQWILSSQAGPSLMHLLDTSRKPRRRV